MCVCTLHNNSLEVCVTELYGTDVCSVCCRKVIETRSVFVCYTEMIKSRSVFVYVLQNDRADVCVFVLQHNDTEQKFVVVCV